MCLSLLLSLLKYFFNRLYCCTTTWHLHLLRDTAEENHWKEEQGQKNSLFRPFSLWLRTKGCLTPMVSIPCKKVVSWERFKGKNSDKPRHAPLRIYLCSPLDSTGTDPYELGHLLSLANTKLDQRIGFVLL
jgi:hypothetical protein